MLTSDIQVIELDSLSCVGYNLKHAALHGARRYDEAIQTIHTMISNLDNPSNIQTRSKPSNNAFTNMFNSLSRAVPAASPNF
jgi:hypothetical protein